MGMGRPTKLNISLSAKIGAAYAKSKTDAEVAKSVGISLRTLQYWKASQPDFLHSLKEIKDMADELVESSLFRRATGYTHPEEKIFVYEGHPIRVDTYKHYPPDVVAAMFWLQNRRPDKWRNTKFMDGPGPPGPKELNGKVSFEEFCKNAGYPEPFEMQLEMMTFGIEGADPRMLLGARGYGKTDYVVILGIAYKIYLNPKFRTLIITKSKERNAAMLKEIANACKANGMVFEKENSHSLRVMGLLGKDHSVSAVTIKTVTLRGRHPDLVVMDDPVTEDDVSEATRAHVKRVYNEVTKLVMNVLVIGQPAHQHDLYAELRPLLRKLEVPHGTIPELDHDLAAQRLAGVDEASIQASYFLKVVTEGTTPFDKVRYIDSFPTGDSAIAFIDPSFEGGDYTAITILKGYMGGAVVVGFVFKKAWNHCLDEINEKLVTYNVKLLCFETNSLGTQPLEILEQVFGKNIGIQGKKSNGNKHSRIMAAGTYAHMIHLCKESDKKYIDQVVKYEYKAKFDDAPDSLASCLEWVGLTRGKL